MPRAAPFTYWSMHGVPSGRLFTMLGHVMLTPLALWLRVVYEQNTVELWVSEDYSFPWISNLTSKTIYLTIFFKKFKKK